MATIKRNIFHEACVALGISGAQILWDFEKFFDTMEVGIVVMAALRYGYPPVPLPIAMLIHIASRVISADGVVSLDVMLLDTSIIAGCSHSVSWTRCFLYDLLDALLRDTIPFTQIKSWVDDLSQRTWLCSHCSR